MILSDQQFMNSSVSLGMCTPKDSHQAAADCQRQRAMVDSISTNEIKESKKMKNSKRFVALMLLVVTIFSVVSVSASASNWQDSKLYDLTLHS